MKRLCRNLRCYPDIYIEGRNDAQDSRTRRPDVGLNHEIFLRELSSICQPGTSHTQDRKVTSYGNLLGLLLLQANTHNLMFMAPCSIVIFEE